MKIGVVGYGSIGQRHAANATKLGHEVIVYDPMLQHNDVKYEREVYDQADAVVIATPSHCHEAGLRACIERGKHALVEKPISTSIGQLPELLNRAKDKKLVVMMGNNLRFHPAVKLVKRNFAVNLWAHFICATTTEKPGYLSDGVVLCTGAHEVDLALHLFGPAKLETATGIHDLIADFVLRHDSGMRSSFHLDFVTPIEIRQFSFADIVESVQVNLRKRTIYQSSDEEKYEAYRETRFIGSYDDDYLDEMTSFIDAINGNALQGATGDDGLATLRLLLDIRQRIALPHD